jgi:hypothetical protein
MQDRKKKASSKTLNLIWKHFILKKNISELLEESSDKSICEVVKNFENPLQLPLEQFNYVAFSIELENNLSWPKLLKI